MNYNLVYEIIILLEKKSLHPRAIAAELKTSHSTISRKLTLLEEDNIVEFVTEGKNKKYHLKNNIEAKSLIIMSEYYAVSRAVKYYPNLRELISVLSENEEIEMAVLYGINPYENAIKNTDINLYIETDNDKIKYEIEKINRQIKVKTGKWDFFNMHVKESINHHLVLKGIEKYINNAGIFNHNFI